MCRAEVEALFEIHDAAAERSDGGRFDDLLAKAVAHHAAAESGVPVPPRTVALSPDTDIASWAPAKAIKADTEALQWIANQMRGKRRGNRSLMAVVATVIGAAALPLSQLPERVRYRDDVSSFRRPSMKSVGWATRRPCPPSFWRWARYALPTLRICPKEMPMEIRPIKNDDDHSAALREIEKLWGSSPHLKAVRPEAVASV